SLWLVVCSWKPTTSASAMRMASNWYLMVVSRGSFTASPPCQRLKVITRKRDPSSKFPCLTGWHEKPSMEIAIARMVIIDFLIFCNALVFYVVWVSKPECQRAKDDGKQTFERP